MLHHHVTYLHSLCLTARSSRKNWLSTAALWVLVLLGQACVSWPIRRDWAFRRERLLQLITLTNVMYCYSSSQLMNSNLWLNANKSLFLLQQGRRRSMKRRQQVCFSCLLYTEPVWSRYHGPSPSRSFSFSGDKRLEFAHMIWWGQAHCPGKPLFFIHQAHDAGQVAAVGIM